jgi:hypothetical protein
MSLSAEVIGKFRVFDRNGDGVIDRKELGIVLKKFDEAWTENRLTRFFKVVDMNGDGRIEYEEFVRWAFSTGNIITQDLQAFRGAVGKVEPASKLNVRIAYGAWKRPVAPAFSASVAGEGVVDIAVEPQANCKVVMSNVSMAKDAARGTSTYGFLARRVGTKLSKRLVPRRLWGLSALNDRLQCADRRSHAKQYGIRAPDFEPSCIESLHVDIPLGSIGSLRSLDTLRATITKPAGGAKRPVVIMCTPYEKLAATLAERSYIVLAVSTRNSRRGSDNTFCPKTQVAHAEAIIDWVIRQDFYDGKIGVHGASYDGFCAYAALDGRHADKITCVATTATCSRLHPIIYNPTGAMNWEFCIRWLWLMIGRMRTDRSIPYSLQTLYHFALCKHSPILDAAFMHTPAAEVDKLFIGSELKFWREGLRNPSESASFWEDKDRLCELRQGGPPMHILAGWSDFFLPGGLEDYEVASEVGIETYLTIGDFSHWDVYAIQQLQTPSILDFCDDKLKGLQPTARKPVRCQLQGSDEWLEMDRFPPDSIRKSFYLGKGAALLTHPSVDASCLQYLYDPEKPTPAIGGASFHPRNCGRIKQGTFKARDDVLIFTSEAATEDLLIVGDPLAVLYVRSELEHFDMVARLCVVQGESSYNICDGMSRQGTYGGMIYLTPPVDSYGIQCVHVQLGSCALRLRAGERLRLQVCSGAHPRWMRNYGTGEDVATATRLNRNHIQLFCDDQHPSHIELPEVSIAQM